MKQLPATTSLLASGCLFVAGCGMHGSDLMEERKVIKPVLAEFEHVVSRSRADLEEISGDLHRKLDDAQRVHDGGRAVKSTLADFMVSGEGARASARMSSIRDAMFEAYTGAKDDIKAMHKRMDISEQTAEWANSQVEKLWEDYKDNRL